MDFLERVLERMSLGTSGSNCLAPGAHLAGRHGFLVTIQAVLNGGCCGSGQRGTMTLGAVSWVSLENLKWELAPSPNWCQFGAWGEGAWDAMGQEGDCSFLRPKASLGLTILGF